MLILIRAFIGLVVLLMIWNSGSSGVAAIVVVVGLALLVLSLRIRTARRQAQHEAQMPPAAWNGQRSATYRGATREVAQRAYHAQAMVAARSGFVPVSEEWSNVLGQETLAVSYAYDPKQAPAILQAIADVEPAASGK
jgi:hypothetical protein